MSNYVESPDAFEVILFCSILFKACRGDETKRNQNFDFHRGFAFPNITVHPRRKYFQIAYIFFCTNYSILRNLIFYSMFKIVVHKF